MKQPITIRRDRRAELLDGLRASLPVIVSSAPFGVLFGALAVDQGMTTGEAVLMSATVFAGASQLVGLNLFGQSVAPWLIVLSVFAVNFRHVLYSAALGRRIGAWPGWKKALGFFFLVDPAFAESEQRGGRGQPMTFLWYMAMVLPIYAFWIVDTWVGAAFGRLFGGASTLGLEFLLPIYFLGLVMGFRDRPRWLPIVAASAVVSILAERFVGSPWHVSIGALAGIALAAALPVRRAETVEQAADDAALHGRPES